MATARPLFMFQDGNAQAALDLYLAFGSAIPWSPANANAKRLVDFAPLRSSW